MGRNKCCKKKVLKFFSAEEKTKEYVSKPSRNKGEVPDSEDWFEGFENHCIVTRYATETALDLDTDSPIPRTPYVRNPDLRPNAEDVKNLNVKELEILLDKNWVEWIKCSKPMSSKKLAPEDVPKDFRFVQPIKLFRMVKEEDTDKRDDVIEGVTDLICDYGMPGSGVGFKCFGYGIPTIHYLTKGARFWIFIKPEGNAKLESLVRGHFKENSNKSGCIGPRSMMFSPALLRKYGIQYNIDIQTPTYSILLYPGVYYAWINLLEDTTSIITHFVTTLWYDWAKKREEDRCNCKEVEEVRAQELSKTKGNMRPRPRAYELDFFKIDAWMAYETHVQKKERTEPKPQEERVEPEGECDEDVDGDWTKLIPDLDNVKLLPESETEAYSSIPLRSESESEEDYYAIASMERVPPVIHD